MFLICKIKILPSSLSVNKTATFDGLWTCTKTKNPSTGCHENHILNSKYTNTKF